MRIRGHLIGDRAIGLKGCSAAPESVVLKFRDAESRRVEDRKEKQKLAAFNKATASTSNMNSRKQALLPAMVSKVTKTEADRAVARMFYANGLAFNVADSKYFKEAIAAVAKCGSGYVSPNRKALSTNLLSEEVELVDGRVKSHLSDSITTGLTVVSDGWSNVQNRPIINFLAVTTEGAVFLDACDTSGEIKDAQYIANSICQQIESIGPEKVVQVITDSASNCVAARKIIADKYPQITCVPCAAHCLDLLLSDIGALPCVASVITEGHTVAKFITCHHASLAYFRSKSKLELLKPAETRFATNFIMLQRLLVCKDALQEIVVSREYKQWIAQQTYKEKGSAVTDTVLRQTFLGQCSASG